MLPIHFDKICATLGNIRRDVEAVQTDGISSPRVLVFGETSGVVSSMFLLAGADVATCDLFPSEVDYIPHFDGDGSCQFVSIPS